MRIYKKKTNRGATTNKTFMYAANKVIQNDKSLCTVSSDVNVIL